MLVSYLTAKPAQRNEIINFAPNGKTPLDYAKSDEMKNILRQRGGKYSSEISIPQTVAPQPEVKSTASEDARTACKAF